jgi:hypothetical protein
MSVHTVYTTTRSNGGKPTCLHADPDCRYVRRMDQVVERDRDVYPDDVGTCGNCWPAANTQGTEADPE